NAPPYHQMVVRDQRADRRRRAGYRVVHATMIAANRPAAPAGTRELSGHLPAPPGNYAGRFPVHPGKMPMRPSTASREHGHTGLTGVLPAIGEPHDRTTGHNGTGPTRTIRTQQGRPDPGHPAGAGGTHRSASTGA